MGKIHDMLVIGGGPGGLTAALYAARAGLSVQIIEKMAPGGQMNLTHQIDNYPGFPDGIDGVSLSENMHRQAARYGAKTVYAAVQNVDLQAAPKAVFTDGGTFYGRTVVIATGADPRPLSVDREREFLGRGVHYCAACDGNFYRGKTVAVVGGGNSAVADALLLSRIAEKVILIHRRDRLRAVGVEADSLLRADNLEFRRNCVVRGICAEDGFRGLSIEDLQNGNRDFLPCDGVFVSIGRVPVTDFARGQVPMDAGGYLLADETTRTAIGGVFAVGDVRTKDVRQVVTAVADGAVAAHMAEGFLDAEGM